MDPVKTEMRQEAISFDQVAYLSKITWSNNQNEGNNVNKITVNKVFQKYFFKKTTNSMSSSVVLLEQKWKNPYKRKGWMIVPSDSKIKKMRKSF